MEVEIDINDANKHSRAAYLLKQSVAWQELNLGFKKWTVAMLNIPKYCKAFARIYSDHFCSSNDYINNQKKSCLSTLKFKSERSIDQG